MTGITAEERVELLLRTFNEARVTYGVGSTGNGVQLMPSMWHGGSYSELERCLLNMRESSQRPLWWHASQRYRWGVERTIIAPVVRRITGPDFRLPPYCELIAGGPAVGAKHAIARIYRWSDAVDEKKAAEGVRVLSESMYDGERWRIVLPLIVLSRRLGLPIEPEVVAV